MKTIKNVFIRHYDVVIESYLFSHINIVFENT